MAKNGNQHSFRFLLEHYWDEVYSIMLKFSKNEDISEELTIKCFGKSFEKISTYNEKYAFNTWLITIAKNLYIDTTREKKINSTFNSSHDLITKYVADNSPDPEGDLIGKQSLETLINKIELLKPKYREVIQLRYIQQLSIKQISKKLKSNESTIKVKLMRAKKLLNEKLQ